jgi:hypothetical protein
MSTLPRHAMHALLRYVYGGDADFTASDALYLMSPENGIDMSCFHTFLLIDWSHHRCHFLLCWHELQQRRGGDDS